MLPGLPWPPPAQPCGGSVPQPTLSPSTQAPILASGIFHLLRLPAEMERRGICHQEGSFPLQKRPFILDPAQQVISVSVRWGVVCSGNQAAKQDAHSIFPRVLLPVPHGCLPCQNIWEWLIQLPRTTTWECMTKTPAAIYWGPHYQRKDYCPAAGRGMNPGECAKIMWGLVNKHGLGRRHSQSHRIRHTACRKDNRWHKNSLFSPSASRRSYWWETCQNFPKSQSLS